MLPKCKNCKFGKNAGCDYPQYDKHHKYIERVHKFTAKSKYYTHCDKHQFDKKNYNKKNKTK